MSKGSSKVKSGGISVLSLLGVLFVGLKLGQVIDWPWWQVTLPFWGPAAIFLGLAALALLVAGLIAAVSALARLG